MKSIHRNARCSECDPLCGTTATRTRFDVLAAETEEAEHPANVLRAVRNVERMSPRYLELLRLYLEGHLQRWTDDLHHLHPSPDSLCNYRCPQHFRQHVRSALLQGRPCRAQARGVTLLEACESAALCERVDTASAAVESTAWAHSVQPGDVVIRNGPDLFGIILFVVVRRDAQTVWLRDPTPHAHRTSVVAVRDIRRSCKCVEGCRGGLRSVNLVPVTEKWRRAFIYKCHRDASTYSPLIPVLRDAVRPHLRPWIRIKDLVLLVEAYLWVTAAVVRDHGPQLGARQFSDIATMLPTGDAEFLKDFDESQRAWMCALSRRARRDSSRKHSF